MLYFYSILFTSCSPFKHVVPSSIYYKIVHFSLHVEFCFCFFWSLSLMLGELPSYLIRLGCPSSQIIRHSKVIQILLVYVREKFVEWIAHCCNWMWTQLFVGRFSGVNICKFTY